MFAIDSFCGHVLPFKLYLCRTTASAKKVYLSGFEISGNTMPRIHRSRTSSNLASERDRSLNVHSDCNLQSWCAFLARPESILSGHRGVKSVDFEIWAGFLFWRSGGFLGHWIDRLILWVTTRIDMKSYPVLSRGTCRASAISQLAKATGVRLRCWAEQTLMPSGTAQPVRL